MSANAVGLAFIGFGVVQPVLAGDYSFAIILKVAVSAVVGYIFHSFALRYLRELED